MVSKGEMWVFDSSCITQLRDAARVRTRSWRVVGSNPIWGLDFFRVPSGFICNTLYLIYVNHCLTFAQVVTSF